MKKSVYLSIFLIAILGSALHAQSHVDFCKKWKIHKYVYEGEQIDPEVNERNDYLQLNQDGSFTGKEEGKLENGTWKWMPDDSVLLLYDATYKDGFPMIVKELTATKLSLVITEGSDTIEAIFVAVED